MESCERATSDFFSAMLSSKEYWYSLFDLDDTSFNCISAIKGTHGPKGFHVYRNTNSIELWNLARGIRVISSLLCCRQRGIGIYCLIWMILPSLCHSCLVYQLKNCLMCLKLLDLLKRSSNNI